VQLSYTPDLVNGSRINSSNRTLPNGEFGPIATTTFPLPSLRPPTDELIALLQLPSMAKLHVPVTMKLIIRNHHPSRAANVTVQLDPEPSDGFIVAGLRNGRVPILLPGAECSLVWKLIPIECGFVQVPKIKVVDRRKGIVVPNQENVAEESTPEAEASGELVKIVDVRWDGRDENGQRDTVLGGPNVDAQNNIGAVLVIP